ncbi:MAG: hypothetical protein ACE5KM_12665 [Planctomycetaceae bacterium]
MNNPRYGKRAVFVLPALIGIGIAAFLVLRRMRDGGPPPGNTNPTPTIQHCLELLFDAAQTGNVEGYLNCFAGPLRSERKQRLGAQPAQKLRASEADLNGFSIIDRQTVREGGSATVVIEKIYPEHQERWRLTMTRDNGDWKIAAMQPLDKTAPETRFGTPVVPELPPGKKLPQ